MRGPKVVLALLAALSSPALACRDEPELRLSWLKDADLVVIGQVSNFRPVPDINNPMTAAYHFELLQRSLDATPAERDQIKRQIRFDFARIDLKVEEVLAGTLPEKLEVTWDTNLFKLPEELAAGSYLIALYAPGRYVSTPARANTWTVLSPTCELSFLVPNNSQAAAAIRKHLRHTSIRKPAAEQTK